MVMALVLTDVAESSGKTLNLPWTPPPGFLWLKVKLITFFGVLNNILDVVIADPPSPFRMFLNFSPTSFCMSPY